MTIAIVHRGQNIDENASLGRKLPSYPVLIVWTCHYLHLGGSLALVSPWGRGVNPFNDGGWLGSLSNYLIFR